MKDKGLYLRGAVYWACVIVPKGLQTRYGQRALRRSLGTSDIREARAKLAAFHAEKRAEFLALDRRLNPETLQPSEALIDALAAAWRRDLLIDDEQVRMHATTDGARRATFAAALADAKGTSGAVMLPAGLLADDDADPFAGLNDTQAEALTAEHQRTLDGWREDAARGRLDVARRALDDQAHATGLRLDWSTPDARALLARFQRSMIDTAQMLVERTQGTMHPTPPASPRLPDTPSRIDDTLRGMATIWEQAEATRKPGTVRKVERAVALFEKFAGAEGPEGASGVRVADVTHAQAADFRAWLLKQGMAPKTAADNLNHVKALFTIAKRRRVIAEDPFDGVTIKAAARSPREGWSMAELGTLFAAPLFQRYDLPTVGKAGADAAYWVPLLALHTGARVTELCQLRTIDVRMVDGIDTPASLPVIDITEGAEDADAGTVARSVKTASSIRCVPVHPTLIRLGFLEYIEAIRKAGHAQLFPAIQVRPDGGAGEYFSTWFGTFKASMGFGRWKDLHNFRHTLRTRLAVCGAAESAIDAIAGHADGARGSTGRQTYTHWSRNLPALADEMGKLTYPGLDLPRVFTAPASTPETRETRSTPETRSTRNTPSTPETRQPRKASR